MKCSSTESETFTVLCHTDYGFGKDDEHGRFFEKGKEYLLITEPRGVTSDSNGKEFISCWVNFNANFGSRFAITGNIYHSWDNGKPYWPQYTDVFYDPTAIKRNNKIESIGI